MIADDLSNWDALDLARVLACKFIDTDDLAEAFPSVNKVDSYDGKMLQEFIENDWCLILAHYDIDDLNAWLDEKEYEEEWERWRDEIAENEYEYLEWRLDEYCWKVIEMVNSFHYMDLAELWGYPPQKSKN